MRSISRLIVYTLTVYAALCLLRLKGAFAVGTSVELEPASFKQDVIDDERVWLVDFYSKLCQVKERSIVGPVGYSSGTFSAILMQELLTGDISDYKIVVVFVRSVLLSPRHGTRFRGRYYLFCLAADILWHSQGLLLLLCYLIYMLYR